IINLRAQAWVRCRDSRHCSPRCQAGPPAVEPRLRPSLRAVVESSGRALRCERTPPEVASAPMNRRAPIEDAAAKRVRVVNPRPKGWPMLVVRTLAVLVVFAVLAGGAGAFGLYTHLAADLPRIDGFDAVSGSSVTRFEAADGQLVGEWYDERRLAV